MRFLSVLLDIFFPPQVRALRARTVSYESLSLLVKPVCIVSTDPPATALLPYRNPLVQAAITEAKFHDAKHAQNALGAVLAEYLAAILNERPCVLIPVPLSRARVRERGYNQAERICRATNLPVDTTLLKRIRDTPPQTGLGGKARRTNLHAAFAVTRTPDVDTLYIVVDDVITTGATLSAVTSALQACGALHLVPVALAHSP